jgi:serine/threonine protein kinase
MFRARPMDAYDPLRVSVAARVGLVLNGKWRLDSLLGVGGMAAVYAATHRNTKRVAVKILHADMSEDPVIRQRFLREGYAANRVGHRGAVDILDDDITDDGSAFLVMELLEGENLDRRMRRKGGALPAAEVLSVADQILDTLAAAHERGILHRDIKPENVFLTREGVVKLLDFGIARVLELGTSAKVTQRGVVLGTPAFMAPEQAMGLWEQVDQRTDVWAVGATLFMLLTGQFVHPVKTGMEALDFAVSRRARSVGSLGVPVHPAVTRLVDRALAFERDARFASAREMQEAVRAAYEELEGDTRMAELSLPDLELLPKQDALESAPPPDHSAAAPEHPAMAPDSPATATPVPGAATTIVGQRKVQQRFVFTVGAVATILVGAGILFVTRVDGPSKVSSAFTPASATSGAGVPARPLASSVAVRELPTGSAALAVPVIAVSALPAETSSGGAAPAVSATASARPKAAPAVTPQVIVASPAPSSAAAPAPSAVPQAPATTAKPTEEPDPFSGRF